MNNPFLLIAPLINVVVTGLFAGMVLQQYIRRRRQHQLYWSLALVMAFLATVAYICMLIVGPTSGTGIIFFRVYYLFGATVMPSWLGLGCIALAGWRRWTRVLVSIVSFLSFLGLAFIFDASINMSQLAKIAGTPGTGILASGPWLIITIVLNTFGAAAVAWVAIYSGWKVLRRQQMVGLSAMTMLWANGCILAGTILIAVAGSLARLLGLESGFWLIMALGWIVLFVGVILAGRRPRPAPGVVVVNEKEVVHSNK